MRQEYLKLTSLAKRYDLHKETMKRKLKELDIKLGEHYIVIGNTVLFHVEKCHNLLISKTEAKQTDEILSRLLV